MIQSAEGKPLNSFYLIKTDGIFQSDEEAANYKNKDGKPIQPGAQAGDLKFVDYNGDGEISDEDRQYMGNAMPKQLSPSLWALHGRNFLSVPCSKV